MLSQQLSLDLQARRKPARELPAIDRLRAILKRQGINWDYRAGPGSHLFRPIFGPHMGYQPMCGFYLCQDIDFERWAYFERDPNHSTPEHREALKSFLASRRRDIEELWGKAC